MSIHNICSCVCSILTWTWLQCHPCLQIPNLLCQKVNSTFQIFRATSAFLQLLYQLTLFIYCVFIFINLAIVNLFFSLKLHFFVLPIKVLDIRNKLDAWVHQITRQGISLAGLLLSLNQLFTWIPITFAISF